MITRRFWGLVFTLIIAFAVVVQLGREAFPLLKDYNLEISERLGEQLGVEISIGEVQAVWEGMRPRLDLFNVIIESQDGEDIFKIERARAEIKILDSLFRQRLYWQRIELVNMQAKAYQDENKTWRIKGLQSTASSGHNIIIDDPLDVFLFGRRVEIKNLNLDLEYSTGHSSHLLVPAVNLENDRDFHRIEAGLQIDDNVEAFRLIIEGRGDPRDAQNFSARGYLEFNNFPMEKVLAATGVEIWDEEKSKHWREGHNLDLKLWLHGSRENGIQASGFLRADGLPVKLPGEFELPAELRSEVHASWQYKQAWQLTLKELEILWPEFGLPLLNAKIYKNRDEPVSLAVDSINIEDWIAFVDDVGLQNTRAGQALMELAPQGRMENIDVKFLADNEDKFSLQANLIDISAEAYKGSPKLGKVNAFLKVGATRGSVEVQQDRSFELFFPLQYRESFQIDRARGRVAWQIDKKTQRTYVSSSLLEVHSKGDKVNGKLYLALPFKREYGEPWMTLSLAARNTSASKYRQFLPYTVPDTLADWLDRSVGDGELRDVEFLYSGTTRKNGKLARSIQLVADVNQGKVAFDQAWPPLEGVNAHIYLDNKNLDVDVTEANILGNHIATAKITLEEKNENLNLLIKGLIKSDARAAMELLQNSPVRNAIGETFDSWEVSGDVNAELELGVPLTGDQSIQKQQVRVDFSKARLGITDLDLVFDEVDGNLHYSSEKGLYTNKLRGKFWGEKVEVLIDSPVNNEGHRSTHINFKGRVAVDDLREWTRRPELHFATGKSLVEGSLVIPADKSSDKRLGISMHSMMEGVALDLPSPVGKQKESQKVFDVQIDVFNNRQELEFVYDHWIKMNIVRGETEVSSAQILFGDRKQQAESGFFDIAGNIETFDLQEWNSARESYFQYIDQNKNINNALPLRFELSVDKCTLGSLAVENISVAGLGTRGDWTLYLDSEFLRGNLIAYDNDRPLFMSLEHIRFPKLPEQEEENQDAEDVDDVETESEDVQAEVGEKVASFLSKLDLTRAIPIDFSAKEVSFGGQNFGEWSFHLEPVEQGIRLENIVANVRGMKIGSKKEPAQFVWTQVEGANSSEFVGAISTGDIADVLQAWGQDKLMESRSAKFILATYWPGAPDEVELKSIEGTVTLDINDGSFVRGAEAGENPLLRLIALFNFDTLARRLRLDFSDLAKQGFAFDKVRGELNFAEGDINIASPLVVESTSSTMQLTGTIDMVDEKLDSDLIVTLPVASNLAVLTAMSAGLPAGVGVYLVSKLFKKQVDRVSSINYSVSGDWDDPSIKVRKVLKNSEPRNMSEDAPEEPQIKSEKAKDQ